MLVISDERFDEFLKDKTSYEKIQEAKNTLFSLSILYRRLKKDSIDVAQIEIAINILNIQLTDMEKDYRYKGSLTC